MAEYLVDTFNVLTPQLLQWRGIRIYVNDAGVVRTENVNNNRPVTLDKVSDYPDNDRQYAMLAPLNVITTFCNYTTFTKYTVRAINDRPFVQVTADLNQPSCGYETPLPEPYDPPNPFGNPNYGAYKRFSYCDWEGVECEVLIEKKDFTGIVTPVQSAGQTPVVIKYNEADEKHTLIRPMEFELNFIENADFQLEQFYSEDQRTFRVTVSKFGSIRARGYIIPDGCRSKFKDGNNEVTLKCTDGLSSLKTVTYPLPLGGSFNLKQSFVAILCYALAPTNLNLDITTICNYYAQNMPTTINDDPLDMATVNPLRLTTEKGTVLTCFQVIEEVCKAWGMFVVQSDGKWLFVRQRELAQAVIRSRTYNYKGLRLIAQNINNKRLAGGVLK